MECGHGHAKWPNLLCPFQKVFFKNVRFMQINASIKLQINGSKITGKQPMQMKNTQAHGRLMNDIKERQIIKIVIARIHQVTVIVIAMVMVMAMVMVIVTVMVMAMAMAMVIATVMVIAIHIILTSKTTRININMTDTIMPVISHWGNGWHGLDALTNIWNVILGLTGNYSQEELKKKYRGLLKKYHPDNYNGDDTYAKKINEAYALLKK